MEKEQSLELSNNSVDLVQIKDSEDDSSKESVFQVSDELNKRED